MIKKTVSLFSGLFCFLAVLPAYGGIDSLQVNKHRESVEAKQFDSELTERYSSREFQYDTLEGESQNLIARLINWFFEKLQDIFGIQASPTVLEFVQNLIYLLLIVGAVYLVIRLLMGKKASSFFSPKSAEVAPLAFEEEHIEQMNVDQLIKDAVAEKNYRLAVRYMHIKVLKLLTLKNQIDWHFEKTNLDYYNEIKDEPLKAPFKKASYLYEYIWYGEFAIHEPEFNSARQHFDDLTTKINSIG